MGFVNGLLANKPFIVESLLSFIDEERQRIVETGLIKQESCDQYLGCFLKKLAEVANNDEMISKLTQLYESMQNVQLHGDRFFEEEARAEPPVIPPQVNDQAVKTKINKVEAFLECQLEKLAYSLGSAGNHRLAYEVEKTIQSIKRGE
jgi:hypothetical protein